MAANPVRTVSPWSLGSGVRLRELIVLPEWVVITGKVLTAFFAICVWLCQHYVISGSVLMLGLGLVQFGTWWAAVPLACLVPGAYWAVRILLMLHAGEATTVRGVIAGLNRARHIRAAWPAVMHELKMSSRGDSGFVPPLTGMVPTASGVKGTVITGSIAVDSHKLVKLETEIASGLFCDRVLVRSLSPSMASIRFDWGQHLRSTYRLGDLPPISRPSDGSPAHIRFGMNADGSPACLVSNLSTLIGGSSGGGKSSTAWAIIAGYLEQVPIRLRVIDPSGIEFAELGAVVGKGLVHDYVSDGSLPGERKMEDFWEDLTDAFNMRLASVTRSGHRWHKPTPEEPLDITIIDELLPIAGELKKESTGHIVGRIAYLGRKAGFVVVALTQASQVDVIGRIRDLFPQRISHRTPNRYMTEAVLGDGAESDGARASQLNINHDRGVAYMASQEVRGYMACRAAWVPDSDTKQIAQGQRPIAAPSGKPEGPTSVYELRDKRGELLYVGIAEADRVDRRWSEHARSKGWWCDVARKEIVDTFPDRETAETAEALAIKRQRPRYNIQHNDKKKEQR